MIKEFRVSKVWKAMEEDIKMKRFPRALQGARLVRMLWSFDAFSLLTCWNSRIRNEAGLDGGGKGWL